MLLRQLAITGGTEEGNEGKHLAEVCVLWTKLCTSPFGRSFVKDVEN